MKGTPSGKPDKNRRKPDDDGNVVFAKYITTRSGKRIYAYQYGLKAFRFSVKKKRSA